MFLQDKSVCVYDQYIRSLISDLQTAMTLAQQNSVLKQKHQSNQYNKRVKDLPLAIGDQVLLANKGCRGKRKLVHRWESVVYTVVASKPSIHVCKICDRAGKEHIVHCNLLLQVNFLPLPETEIVSSDHGDAETFIYSVPSQMSAATCCGGLTGHTHNDDSSCIDEIESTEHADDKQNEAKELSQAFYVSNISSIATCDDDCTSSWVHSLLPNQEEPNVQVAVPVTDDDTVADQLSASHGLPTI